VPRLSSNTNTDQRIALTVASRI